MEPCMKKTGQYIQDSRKATWKTDMGRWILIIRIYIKVIGRMIRWAVKVNIFTKMEINLKVISSMGKKKDMEKLFMWMEIFIKESGKTISKMIRMVNLYFKAVIYILVNLKMVLCREWGKFKLLMREFMKENFKMGKLMGLERWIIKMAQYMKGNGWMIRFMGKEDWYKKV